MLVVAMPSVSWLLFLIFTAIYFELGASDGYSPSAGLVGFLGTLFQTIQTLFHTDLDGRLLLRVSYSEIHKLA